jgi:hypothetical protein
VTDVNSNRSSPAYKRPTFFAPGALFGEGSRQNGIGLFEKERQSDKCTSYKGTSFAKRQTTQKSCGPLKTSVIGVLGIDMAGVLGVVEAGPADRTWVRLCNTPTLPITIWVLNARLVRYGVSNFRPFLHPVFPPTRRHVCARLYCTSTADVINSRRPHHLRAALHVDAVYETTAQLGRVGASVAPLLAERGRPVTRKRVTDVRICRTAKMLSCRRQNCGLTSVHGLTPLS